MSSITERHRASDTAHLRTAELATLVGWGDLHGLEVAIKPAGADTEGEMVFIGYGEGIATWTVYWIEGLMWLAFLPDPSGQGFEGWKVEVESLDEAMSWIIAETEK